jgi:hypothetical protein
MQHWFASSNTLRTIQGTSNSLGTRRLSLFQWSMVNGRDRYLCCLVEEPPADIDFDPTESSYQKHLQQTLFN